MSTELNVKEQPSILARALAPEDLKVGQYVSVLYEVRQYLQGFWSCENAPLTIQRLEILPDEASSPRLVVDVCLPLVLLKTHRGKHALIDTRRNRLAAVSAEFGKRVFAEFEADRKKAEGKDVEKEKKKKKGKDE